LQATLKKEGIGYDVRKLTLSVRKLTYRANAVLLKKSVRKLTYD